MDPKVSIIVPVYRVENYLDMCVNSIVSQTYPNLEIILVDDGSPDSCPEKCDDWGKRDSRIRVIHKENEGVSKARNLGMNAATGEFVMFVDSDDRMPENAVQLLLERLLEDDSDMAVGKLARLFENGKTDASRYEFMKDQVLDREDFLCAMANDPHYDVGPCAKIYKRKVLHGIEFPQMTCGEDMWVFPHIVLQCSTVSVVAHVVYYYFQRSDSVMHSRQDSHSLQSVRATQHMTEIFWERNHPECASCWFGFGVQYIQEMDEKQRGVDLMKELFPEGQIKQLLRGASFQIRVKWFLLQHLKIYDFVFGIKNTLFA